MLAAAFGVMYLASEQRQIGACLAVVVDLGLSDLHRGRAFRFARSGCRWSTSWRIPGSLR